MVLVTRVSWNKYLLPSGLPRPLPFHVRAYTKDQLATLIATKLREGSWKTLSTGKSKKDLFFPARLFAPIFWSVSAAFLCERERKDSLF